MPMPARCPTCGAEFKLEAITSESLCPNCSSPLKPSTPTNTCPMCAEPLEASVRVCKFCGAAIGGRNAPRVVYSTREDQSANTKAVVAFIFAIFGLGCLLLAPVALIMGLGVNRRLRAVGLPPNGLATASFIMGIIGIATSILFVLPIVAAITIPAIFSAKQAADEHSALAAMKQIFSAEQVFRASDSDRNGINDFWDRDLAGLYGLSPEGSPIALIPREVALADRDASTRYPALGAPKSYNGYWIIALRREASEPPPSPKKGEPTPQPAYDFAFCAFPEVYGSTGRRTFIVDASGTIWHKDTRGDPILQFPQNPLQQGWEPH